MSGAATVGTGSVQQRIAAAKTEIVHLEVAWLTAPMEDWRLRRAIEGSLDQKKTRPRMLIQLRSAHSAGVQSIDHPTSPAVARHRARAEGTASCESCGRLFELNRLCR
jgi:hypothetical protein